MMLNNKIINKILEMTLAGSGGFTGSADSEGPVAGYDHLTKFKSKNKKKVDYRKVPLTYRKWVEALDK